MKHKTCTYPGFEGLYEIYENGDIFSYQSNKFLKQTPPSSFTPYVKVTLMQRVKSVHQLVCHEFNGPAPSPLHEVNHKDLNKENNHYSNLEWLTHSQNIYHARTLKQWRSGPPKGFKHRSDTKQKMAEKKFKKVVAFNETEQIPFRSIQEASEALSINRRTLNRYLGSARYINGYRLKYA